jgi:Domain of unknown function (DUF222)
LTIEHLFDILGVSPRTDVEVRVTKRDHHSSPIEAMDALHGLISGHLRELFAAIAVADRNQSWRDSGARDMAAWLSMRYGMSQWKARRWIAAAHALEGLPRLGEALAQGELGVDKVVEVARFATPGTEARLIRWAQGVSVGAIRRKADLASPPPIAEVREADRARSVQWWYFDDGKRFGMHAELAAAEGAVVARALEREAERVPVMPGEAHPCYAEARRADALVALASAATARDAHPDRATVVIHARAEELADGTGGCEIEGGPVIHPHTARHLLCQARVQQVREDHKGEALEVGRTSRDPAPWMLRQLRYRDYGCRFPGCEARRFTQAHHVVWWRHGGRTEMGNLVLLCMFHHKLVHEYGWRIRRGGDGTVRWFRPDGRRYRTGRGPPRMETVEPASLSSVGL